MHFLLKQHSVQRANAILQFYHCNPLNWIKEWFRVNWRPWETPRFWCIGSARQIPSCHMRLSTLIYLNVLSMFNTLRPRQNGRHFPDDIFKWIFLNKNVWISIIISLKFVPRGPINNISTLVQVMAWRRTGDKPLSEPMMARLPTHICVTQPQWVKEQSASLGAEPTNNRDTALLKRATMKKICLYMMT